MTETLPAQARAEAAHALSQILTNNRTIDWVQEKQPLTSPLSHELVYGVCRYFFSLEGLVQARLDKPLRKKDFGIYCLLLVGTYQLTHTRIQSHAVINETVNACKTLKRPWAKGLVNAILRQIDRDNLKDTEQSFDKDFSELPPWLEAAFKADYPTLLAELNAANLSRAPMCLRVNGHKTSAAAYKQTLQDIGIEHATLDLPYAIRLMSAQSAAQLPHWEEGHVAVQDFGAQWVSALALALCDAHAHPNRLLDACAAPGGKVFALKEQATADQISEWVALEKSPTRIASAAQIATRLGHTVEFLQGDATSLAWWDHRPFDFILIDAPCSGTGTLRRHPEIKLLLNPEDVTAHAELQLQLLQNLWSTLAVEGTLLYCTCSLLAAENDHVIEAFLASLANASLDTQAQIIDVSKHLPATTGQPTQQGWQLLPTDPTTDGFYVAALRKGGPAAPQALRT